jgi:hypothetical protein
MFKDNKVASHTAISTSETSPNIDQNEACPVGALSKA